VVSSRRSHHCFFTPQTWRSRQAETAEEFNMLQKTEVAGIEKAVSRMVCFSATEEAKHYAELERMADITELSLSEIEKLTTN
jgi:hypothetical protein